MTTGAIGNIDSMTGLQKAAVLVMSLPDDQRRLLFERLNDDQKEQVAGEMAALSNLSHGVVQSVLAEFRAVAQALDVYANDGMEAARSLLEKTMSRDKANMVMSRIAGRVSDTGLRRLKRAAPEALAAVFRVEHPQTIAVVLTHFDPAKAAAVLQSLDAKLAKDVLFRMARLGRVAPEMLSVIESGLANKVDLSLSNEATITGGANSVAQVLMRTTPTYERQLLDMLGSEDADLARRIAEMMFTFDDLRKLMARDVARVLKDVAPRELALAMKTANPEVRSHILAALSKRAAEIVQDEFDALGPVKLKDVEEAQSKITAFVRAMEQNGDLIIPGRGDSDAIIS
jgi:flagellar motor switch protein FliG